MYVCMYNIYNSTIYSKVKTYVLMNNYINAKKKNHYLCECNCVYYVYVSTINY